MICMSTLITKVMIVPLATAAIDSSFGRKGMYEMKERRESDAVQDVRKHGNI
jgi:hypothetical protein